jgi:hypothetical protein
VTGIKKIKKSVEKNSQSGIQTESSSNHQKRKDQLENTRAENKQQTSKPEKTGFSKILSKFNLMLVLVLLSGIAVIIYYRLYRK